MVARTPDTELVYLHCSSIFTGGNAQIRRQKSILRVLNEHKASIKTLTKEFPLNAIAIVIQPLLADGVFGSQSRARLRFPELFRASETRKAERAASEATVARIEAEAIHEIVVISDEEWDEAIPESNNYTTQDRGVKSHSQAKTIDQSTQQKFKVEDRYPNSSLIDTFKKAARQLTCLSKLPTSTQEQDTKLVPQFHPVYWPFKTQHQILTLVQSMLEECCFDFGNAWVPQLMSDQKWEEPEAVELTQWIKRFSKYATNLPTTATSNVSGGSLMQILWATSNLRHSAVHRLSTSAAGILTMIDAAVSFTEALKDKERSLRIQEIRTRLANIVEDIIQHQNVLEHKLSEQLSDLARRRAEIYELERSAIEDILSDDSIYRTSAASTVNQLLATSQPNACTCSPERNIVQEDLTPGFDSGEDDDQAKSEMSPKLHNVIEVSKSAELTTPYQQDSHPQHQSADNARVETISSVTDQREHTRTISDLEKQQKKDEKEDREFYGISDDVAWTEKNCHSSWTSSTVDPFAMENAAVDEGAVSVAADSDEYDVVRTPLESGRHGPQESISYGTTETQHEGILLEAPPIDDGPVLSRAEKDLPAEGRLPVQEDSSMAEAPPVEEAPPAEDAPSLLKKRRPRRYPARRRRTAR